MGIDIYFKRRSTWPHTYTPFPRGRFDSGSTQNASDRGFVSTGSHFIRTIIGPNRCWDTPIEKVVTPDRFRSDPPSHVFVSLCSPPIVTTFIEPIRVRTNTRLHGAGPKPDRTAIEAPPSKRSIRS